MPQMNSVFVESGIEALARNMSRLFENYYAFLNVSLYLLSEIKDLDSCIHISTQILYNSVEYRTELLV